MLHWICVNMLDYNGLLVRVCVSILVHIGLARIGVGSVVHIALVRSFLLLSHELTCQLSFLEL